jgi:hypothetical protein
MASKSKDNPQLFQEAQQATLSFLDSMTEGYSVSKMLEEEQERKDRLEKKIKEDVFEYFQNLKIAQTLVQKNNAQLKVMKTNLKDLDASTAAFAWAKSPSIERLNRLRKNLSQVVDTLHDFLNVSGQMKNLKELMKDSRFYEHVFRKLRTISSLRDSMREKAQSSKKLEITFRNFETKFQEMQQIEELFYKLIFENVVNSIELAKVEPTKLARTLNIINLSDEGGKEKEVYFLRAKEALRLLVKTRFESRLNPNTDDIAEKLEAAKYSVDDLMDVHQYLTKIYPEKYDIFNFMRSEYKALIQSLVMPYLTNLNSIKQDPGVIIYFISWLDNYEILLKRVGIETSEYADLREVNGSLTLEIQRISTLLYGPHHRALEEVDQEDAEDER